MKKILAISGVVITLSSCVPAFIIGGASLLGYSASQERTVGDAINDASIETQINAYMVGSKDQMLFSDVEIDSVEGRVLLTGDVPTKEAKLNAYNLAWRAKGVREVINEIQVKEEHRFSPANEAKDTWITTQIGSAMLFNKKIQSRNYSVETINGVVYLMGVAQNKQELDMATSIASQIKGVQKVVSYVRIKGSKIPVSSNQGNSVDNIANEVYKENNKPVNNSNDIIIEDISKDKGATVNEQNQPNNNLQYYRKPLVEDLSGS